MLIKQIFGDICEDRERKQEIQKSRLAHNKVEKTDLQGRKKRKRRRERNRQTWK